MKFIKTADGWYINRDKTEGFTVRETKSKGFNVCAYIDESCWTLKTFLCDPKSTTQFDPKAEAQAWLDNLIAGLDKEED
ncbi:MAG: hypothetical protein J5497_02405 [Selenomonadaceae bacterium]|nr:hypothetical protein [Selenomonadaceae bacterium]